MYDKALAWIVANKPIAYCLGGALTLALALSIMWSVKFGFGIGLIIAAIMLVVHGMSRANVRW